MEVEDAEYYYDGEGEYNGDDKYDINYVVDRPTSKPEGRMQCQDIGDVGTEGELDCEDEATPPTPYKNYRKYKTWKRKPLFVIIIGG